MQMKAHLARHWWVWLLIAAVVITANEVFDRAFSDEAHWDADIFLAVVVVAVASYGSYRVGRRRAAI
jgi:hypothetical protein